MHISWPDFRNQVWITMGTGTSASTFSVWAGISSMRGIEAFINLDTLVCNVDPPPSICYQSPEIFKLSENQLTGCYIPFRTGMPDVHRNKSASLICQTIYAFALLQAGSYFFAGARA
jgi:hypothetical protein